jgi:hypothetical protein
MQPCISLPVDFLPDGSFLLLLENHQGVGFKSESRRLFNAVLDPTNCITNEGGEAF